MCFHAIEFAGCRIFPSSTSPSLCQRIYSDVFALMYNLCKRGVTGKYLKIFCGTHLFGAASSLHDPSFSSELDVFHLDSPLVGHVSMSAYSFQNITQSLMHACIFS